MYRPPTGPPVEKEPLHENFWSAGQLSLFKKGLKKRGFHPHEIQYVDKKVRPENESIVDEVLGR